MSDRPEHDAAAPAEVPSRQAFSKDDLARAARRRLEQAAAPPPRRRRPPRWRLVLWGFEAVVLLAVLEAFVLRPWWQRRHAAAAVPVSPAIAREPAPVVGAAAPALAGLTEVVPAFLAPLEGLAEGSATMRAAQLAYSRDTRLPIEVRNSLGMRFRLVPPGTAILGSPADEPGRGDTELQHVFVAMEPFYLGACEVTQAEWSQLMPANPSRYSGPQRPVEEVTWYECQRFLTALCQREGVPEGTYRLPSESEWEYACRAGTATAYCCGSDPRCLDAFAIHGDNGGSGTTDVGLRRPNALGLYDLHGNVWEWCLNRFAPYPNDTRPADPEYESWRCLRGGNWYVPPVDCRSAGRNRLPPTSKGNMLGFRVLRRIDLPAPPAPPAAPPAPAPAAR
ncbi:MAG: formylglycine-generating enzyme family protein [Lentisphaerae bacterium]|nr:formylglycine-generating enzyme family protein [Lentisphaerota bacterium]